MINNNNNPTIFNSKPATNGTISKVSSASPSSDEEDLSNLTGTIVQRIETQYPTFRQWSSFTQLEPANRYTKSAKDLFFNVVANVICPLALMTGTSFVGELCCTSSFRKLIEQGNDVLRTQCSRFVILLTFIFMVLINTNA